MTAPVAKSHQETECPIYNVALTGVAPHAIYFPGATQVVEPFLGPRTISVQDSKAFSLRDTLLCDPPAAGQMVRTLTVDNNPTRAFILDSELRELFNQSYTRIGDPHKSVLSSVELDVHEVATGLHNVSCTYRSLNQGLWEKLATAQEEVIGSIRKDIATYWGKAQQLNSDWTHDGPGPFARRFILLVLAFLLKSEATVELNPEDQVTSSIKTKRLYFHSVSDEQSHIVIECQGAVDRIRRSVAWADFRCHSIRRVSFNVEVLHGLIPVPDWFDAQYSNPSAVGTARHENGAEAAKDDRLLHYEIDCRFHSINAKPGLLFHRIIWNRQEYIAVASLTLLEHLKELDGKASDSPWRQADERVYMLADFVIKAHRVCDKYPSNPEFDLDWNFRPKLNIMVREALNNLQDLRYQNRLALDRSGGVPGRELQYYYYLVLAKLQMASVTVYFNTANRIERSGKPCSATLRSVLPSSAGVTLQIFDGLKALSAYWIAWENIENLNNGAIWFDQNTFQCLARMEGWSQVAPAIRDSSAQQVQGSCEVRGKAISRKGDDGEDGAKAEAYVLGSGKEDDGDEETNEYVKVEA